MREFHTFSSSLFHFFGAGGGTHIGSTCVYAFTARCCRVTLRLQVAFGTVTAACLLGAGLTKFHGHADSVRVARQFFIREGILSRPEVMGSMQCVVQQVVHTYTLLPRARLTHSFIHARSATRLLTFWMSSLRRHVVVAA
jgi:hypothetical protein